MRLFPAHGPLVLLLFMVLMLTADDLSFPVLVVSSIFAAYFLVKFSRWALGA